LKASSDIIFAYWLRDNPNPKNLKYYFCNYITNGETLAIIATILKAKGHATPPYWPGVALLFKTVESEQYTADQEAAAVLLGKYTLLEGQMKSS
jgi:hypothetical protein